MAFRILRDEDKQVSISFTCKKKNRENLMRIITDVINNYEDEGVLSVQHQRVNDFVYHREFCVEKKRNKNFSSLLDCISTYDLNKHFNR